MTGDRRSDDGFIVQPGKVIAALVREVEPVLDQAGVEAAIGQAAPTRAQQRRLAAALSADLGLLTSGRPEGPPQIELLVRALQQFGAKRVVLPKCGHCRRPKRLTQLDGDLRICSACDLRRRKSAQPCAICGGSLKHAAYRDHQGRLRCRRCRPDDHPDPTTQILTRIASLGPGLDEVNLREVIDKAIPQPFQLQKALRELDQRPDLLTGQGAHGSPRINALIQALIAAGAASVVAPACPSCGRTVSLSHRRGALRCCRRCYDQERLEICSRCQQLTPVSSRTSAGEPVCGNCFRADSNNYEQCVLCGRIALVGLHNEDGSAWCRGCYRAPLAICSLCDREKPCHFASTDRPRCENCSRLMRRVPCAGCGNSRAVWTRTDNGQPLCGTCSRTPEPCASCGNSHKVRARLPEGPLCSTCYRKHPTSFQPCIECGVTEHLYHFGLCTRCACRRYLLELVTDDQAELRPHAEAIYRVVIAAGDPESLMQWLTRSRSTAREILTDISHADQPPTHDTLDRYRPSRAAHHLRRVLVAGGVLPERDERLADLEHWVRLKTDQVTDPAERRILRSFASWHHLRRLRRESERRHITAEQADYLHNEVRAALKLITWLRETDKSLATCTQHDIDTWLAEAPGTHYHARAFVLWTSKRGHTHDLDIPQLARSEALAQIEDDQRWSLVRGLLHDDTHALEDRVAGLLVLLYGQPLGRIVRLTRDHIIQSPTRVELLLGSVPLDLPAPLDDLVRQLLNRTNGNPNATADKWLFPGRPSSHPLSASHLKKRLARLGIHGRSGRNTALMDLAAKLPPVALARLVGIHLSTAGVWAERAGGSSAAYAAQVSRR